MAFSSAPLLIFIGFASLIIRFFQFGGNSNFPLEFKLRLKGQREKHICKYVFQP